MFSNPSFEIPEDEPGLAMGWAVSSTNSMYEFAVFNQHEGWALNLPTLTPTDEGMGGQFINVADGSLVKFAGPGLKSAQENFSVGFKAVEVYRFSLEDSNSEAAAFQGKEFDDFEGGWGRDIYVFSTQGSTTTLVYFNPRWFGPSLVGYKVFVGEETVRTVTANDATSITVSPALSGNPVIGTQVRLVGGFTNEFGFHMELADSDFGTDSEFENFGVNWPQDNPGNWNYVFEPVLLFSADDRTFTVGTTTLPYAEYATEFFAEVSRKSVNPGYVRGDSRFQIRLPGGQTTETYAFFYPSIGNLTDTVVNNGITRGVEIRDADTSLSILKLSSVVTQTVPYAFDIGKFSFYAEPGTNLGRCWYTGTLIGNEVFYSGWPIAYRQLTEFDIFNLESTRFSPTYLASYDLVNTTYSQGDALPLGWGGHNLYYKVPSGLTYLEAVPPASEKAAILVQYHEGSGRPKSMMVSVRGGRPEDYTEEAVSWNSALDVLDIIDINLHEAASNVVGTVEFYTVRDEFESFEKDWPAAPPDLR